MQRLVLSAGAVIQLNNRDYTIDAVIGDGATCVVYSAHYTDSAGYPHQVNLKECYPYHAEIRRDQRNMLWQSGEEKAQSFCAFSQAYDKLMTWQNNTTVKAFDMCEANNTLYIVMDADQGQPFDKDTRSSLHELLQTVLALTKTVQKYHDNGYLHLDIKPSNFLTIPETRELVILFDLDTVTAISDIRSGNVRCVSYSDGWAAPEQKQGKLDKLCPATDIFAIGAILFEKVMGRQVAPADMSIFADWDFGGELFDDVNPKAQKYLREVFNKTLAASVKRRYQRTDELVSVLEQAVHATSGIPFIQTENICSTINFIGREKELQDISRAFSNGARAVILHGFSGIGKSELAKAFAQQSRQYDVTLLIRYGKDCNSIADWLENLYIENYDAIGKVRIQKAKSLLDENTLIVLDNFNIKPGKDNGLADLLRTKARILVTTTTNLSDIYRSIQQIEIEALSVSQLKTLFELNSGMQINSECLPIFEKLLKKVEFHTYFVDLLARQMQLSGVSLSELYQEVQTGIASSNNPTYVESTKDDGWYEDTIANIMRVLFEIADLSEGQKQVLRNMCLLDFVEMTRPAYKEITGSNNLNDFNSLIRLGYIQEGEGIFTTHSLLNDLIWADMAPCWDNCTSVFNYVLEVVNWFDQYGEFTLADQDEADIKGIFLYRFFALLDFSKEENVRLCLRWVHFLFEGDFFIADVANPNIRFLQVFSFLDNAAATTTSKLRFEIYFSLFKVWLRHCKYCSVAESEDDYKELSVRQQQAIKYYHQALDAVHDIDISIARECEKDIHVEVAAIIEETSMSRRMIEKAAPNITCENHFLIEPGIPAELVRYSYLAYPECFKLYAWDKKYYGIPLTEEDLSEEPYDFDAWGTQGNEDDEWLRKTKEIEDDYRTSTDRLRFILSLHDNTGYDAAQKVSLLEYLLDLIFDPLLMIRSRKNIEKARQHIQRMDWKYAEWLLDIERDIVLDNADFDWCEADEEYISHIPKYRAVLAAMFDYDSFDDWMERVNDVDQQYAVYKTSVGFGHSLCEVATACWCLGKCNLILPYLVIALEDQLPELGDTEYEDTLRECYDMIATIADYANKASLEIEESDAHWNEFMQIQKTSKHMMDMITGKRFEIKPEEDN